MKLEDQEERLKSLLIHRNRMKEMALILRDIIDKYDLRISREELKECVKLCLEGGKLYTYKGFNQTVSNVLGKGRLKFLKEIVQEIKNESDEYKSDSKVIELKNN